MTNLHIRIPTKTRLYELKMACFFRNSSGSIFDDYSKFILFNKICSETNYISEHDINTLFRPPCLGRNLFRGGGPKYKNKIHIMYRVTEYEHRKKKHLVRGHDVLTKCEL